MTTIVLLSAILVVFITFYLYFYQKNLFASENNEPVSSSQQLVENKILDYLVKKDSHPASKYYLFNNILLPLKNTLLRADHLLISTRGIFILETTHCQGNITYHKDSGLSQEINDYTQRVYTSTTQNITLLDELSLFLPEIESKHIHYLNVFTAQCKFSSLMPSHVIKLEDLVNTIEGHKHSIPFNQLLYAVGIITSNRTNRNNISPSRKSA